jgi:hypothetical protein
MEAESFFSRWSRRKSEVLKEEQDKAAAAGDEAGTTDAAGVPLKTGAITGENGQAPEAQQPPPTMEDVAKLTPDSDFKPFVARGVDDNIRRSALKKLFADPHFNIMDGLDIYIEDYNKFEPIPPEMLAMLEHAKSVLDPLGQLKKPMMALLDSDPTKDGEQEKDAQGVQDKQQDEREEQAQQAEQAEQEDQEGRAANDVAAGAEPADTPQQAREDSLAADANAARAKLPGAPEETMHNPEPPNDPIQSL